MPRVVLSLLLCSLCWNPACLSAAEADPVPVGAASVDITPPYPIRLTGYGSRSVEAEGVEQKLHARALAIGSDEAGPAVVVAVELLGISPQLRADVLARVNMTHEISNDKFVLCVTHTHNGPCVNNVCPLILGDTIREPEQERIDDYTTRLVDLIASAATKALENRRPGHLFRGEGTTDFAVNRRVIKDGVWTGFGVNPDGPVDHRLPILVAEDEQGKLIAVWSNYACHCTTLGPSFNKICGDWAGFASANLEADHPGAVALISIGCGADANPEPRDSGKPLEYAKQHGETFRQAVNQILAGELKPLSSSISGKFTTVKLPFKEPRTEEEWKSYAEQPGQRGVYGRYFLEKLKAGGEIPANLDYAVSTLTFGDDLAMVFLAGEVVCDYALRMYDAFDADRLWVSSYANNVPCYIPSRRILKEQGYEADHSMVYYRQPNQLSPAIEDIIVDTVQKLLPQKFYSAQLQQEFPPAKTPEEAISSFRLPKGLKLELVACEPLVSDPVAFDWGMDGSLWVVEMGDYPLGVDGTGKPGGCVKVLRDTDRDGKYDSAKVFLKDVPFPTGVKVWRQGVLITSAPRILYAEDTDDDDVADATRTLYEGFTEGNQQHRLNGMRWGLDNWLYVGNGDSGGAVRSSLTGKKIDIRRRDVRIRPDTGELEAVSGNTQFGISRDDWGNWFGGNNSNPMWHYVLNQRYLERNPYVVFPESRVMVSDQPGAAPVFPASRTLGRYNDFDRLNRFTSACSPIIYRDHFLGREYAGNSFVCEPVHNLVHREAVRPSGVTFRSWRVATEQESEFLASTDNWFRPTMVRTGPDGCLWVSDMYRFVIEHPEWIPEHQQRKVDLRAGSDMGRIYRIAPQEGAKPVPVLSALNEAQLVEQLYSPNGTLRDMASQLMLWSTDQKILEPLMKIIHEDRPPLAQTHALAILAEHPLSDLKAGDLETLLKKNDPRILRQAVRVSERFVNEDTQIGKRWISLCDTDDALLRMQLAYSFGEWDLEHAGIGLGILLKLAPRDPYLTAAAVSSLNKHNLGDVVQTVLKSPESRNDLAVVTPLLQTAIGLNLNREVEHLLQANLIIDQKNTVDVIEHWSRLVAGLANRRPELEAVAAGNAQLMYSVRTLNTAAQTLALDDSAQLSNRITAIDCLGSSPGVNRELIVKLAELIHPGAPVELQSAVLKVLSQRGTDQSFRDLLGRWDALAPSLKSALLEVLTTRESRAALLLKAIQRKQVLPTELTAVISQRLLQHRDKSIREQAEALLGSTASRAEILEARKGTLQLFGDMDHGKVLFKKHCSQCHKVKEEGYEIGPDLVALTNRSPEVLYLAILDPNAAVEDKFIQYIAVTQDGITHTGRLLSETANTIVLEGPEKKRAEILYNDLEVLRSTGKSMMPEGLEKELDDQGLADLIAYVSEIGPEAKSSSGLTPQPVRQDSPRIELPASKAFLYGPSISYESEYRHLDHWSTPQDRAVWKLEVTEPGRYVIVLDYSCDPLHADNPFKITIGRQELEQKVHETRSWDEFERHEHGTVELQTGVTRVILQSVGAIKRDALFNLRGVTLVKVD